MQTLHYRETKLIPRVVLKNRLPGLKSGWRFGFQVWLSFDDGFLQVLLLEAWSNVGNPRESCQYWGDDCMNRFGCSNVSIPKSTWWRKNIKAAPRPNVQGSAAFGVTTKGVPTASNSGKRSQTFPTRLGYLGLGCGSRSNWSMRGVLPRTAANRNLRAEGVSVEKNRKHAACFVATTSTGMKVLWRTCLKRETFVASAAGIGTRT